MLIAERKRIQDKLVLLNGKELDEVDVYIEYLIAQRRKITAAVKE